MIDHILATNWTCVRDGKGLVRSTAKTLDGPLDSPTMAAKS